MLIGITQKPEIRVHCAMSEDHQAEVVSAFRRFRDAIPRGENYEYPAEAVWDWAALCERWRLGVNSQNFRRVIFELDQLTGKYAA